jgi:hypothetical protein
MTVAFSVYRSGADSACHDVLLLRNFGSVDIPGIPSFEEKLYAFSCLEVKGFHICAGVA